MPSRSSQTYKNWRRVVEWSPSSNRPYAILCNSRCHSGPGCGCRAAARAARAWARLPGSLDSIGKKAGHKSQLVSTWAGLVEAFKCALCSVAGCASAVLSSAGRGGAGMFRFHDGVSAQGQPNRLWRGRVVSVIREGGAGKVLATYLGLQSHSVTAVMRPMLLELSQCTRHWHLSGFLALNPPAT